MRARLVLSALCVLCGSVLARADVIHQPGGGKIVGVIVEEKEDHVTIRTRAGGLLRVPRDEIDRIEKGPMPEGPPAPKPAPPVTPQPKRAPVPVPAPVTATAAPLGPAEGPSPRGLEETGLGVDEAVDPTRGMKAARDLLAWFDPRKAEIRRELAKELKKRRREALEFIMDPKRYPEANHGAEAQPEVDRLVKQRLRAVYEDPIALVLELNARPRSLYELVEEADDPAPLRAKINRALWFVDAPADDRDRENLEDAQRAAAFNAKVPGLDPEERACMDETNRYRLLFGLKALRYDERLVRAARKHSRSMVELDFFDHASPVKGLETPEKRVAAEGATYSAENIAAGTGIGRDAFEMWYNSSGHHRNMLGDHASIGVGRHQTLWTQNFGKDILK